MKTTIAKGDVELYRERGFVWIQDLLDADELEAWRADVDAAVAARDAEHPGAVNAFLRRVNLWRDTPAIRARVLDPRIGRLAAELEGARGMRLWQDYALIKDPWADPVAFHRDVPYWSFDSTHAITLTVALDDVTPHNGCLHFLPGTHARRDYTPNAVGGRMADLFDEMPDLRGVEATPSLIRAGSASFHNGLVVHGANANMTPFRRRSLTIAMMPADARFNGKSYIFPEAMTARWTVGEPLDDDACFPWIYEGR